MPAASPFIPHTSIIEWVPLDRLRSEPLRVAAAYWTMIRGDRRFPARDDLRARAMSGILPYISLVRVIDGGTDFEHRIVGDIMVQAFTVPIQNRKFSDIAKEAPELIELSFRLFREAVALRAPVAWRQRTGREATHTMYTDSEIVLLPLGKTDEVVDHILGFGTHQATVSPAT